MRPSGRVALVVGAASGLGHAAAAALREVGADVIAADRAFADATATDAVAREAHLDVRVDAAVAQLIDDIVATAGRLDIVVNCAGIVWREPVFDGASPHSVESFRSVIETNTIGTFNVLAQASAAMARNDDDDGERGVIINVASTAGLEGHAGAVAYATSKSAVIGMTLPAARDLAPYGIRCMAIAPGFFDTPILSHVDAERRATLTGLVPFPPRFGDPAEFGQLVVAIVENRYLNGEVIRLDGAMRMAARV